MYPEAAWTSTNRRQSRRNGKRSGRPSGPSTPRIPSPEPSRGRSSTCSRCCPTPPARCTWDTSSTTRLGTSSRTSGAETAGPSCARWAGTRSACLLRTRRFAKAAIRREIVERNIEHIRGEMRRLGWVIDWDREVGAHEPEYYRWTQWLFLKFFEAGLAYRKEAPVNWCPNDQTVVANEYVIDGKCERCGAEVVVMNMEQWFFRITAYADQLLEDLELIDWPERTKTIQRNWIGRSEGAEVLFRDEELDVDIPVFTTRPDTLYGATFFVLAPEHPLVEQLATEEVRDYVKAAATRSVADRQTKDKDGVFTGHYVVNPVNDERIPVWVADYVLMDYGTGAIMAVPAHDERDLDFARANDLPVTPRDRRGDERADQLGRFQRPARGRGEDEDRRMAARAGSRSACCQLPPARLVDVTSALLGLPDPGRLLRGRRNRAGPGGSAPGPAARGRGLPAEGQAAAGLQRGVDECGVPQMRQARAARGGHDGHVRRLLLVLPALLRPAQRPGAVGSQVRGLLDAGRPVHRRHRPHDGAPALLALLHEGAERLRPRWHPRAVPAPVPPGLGAPGRNEDVEDEGERDRPRPAGGHVRGRRGPALHAVHRPGRSGHGLDRGGRRGHLALPAAAVARS